MSKPAGKHIITHRSNRMQFIAGNGTPLRAVRYPANSLCRCGSGMKTKRCCGVGSGYFNTEANAAVDDRLARQGFKKMQL